MCDDTTEAENEAYLRQRRLTRREVGLGTGAALTAFLAGCQSPPPTPARESDSAKPTPPPTPSAPERPAPADTAPPTRETAGRRVMVETPDGQAEAFFVTPTTGRHPAVLVWPDIAGLRDAYEKMATRLAGEGYAVLAVNQYYRSSKLPILSGIAEWRTDEGKAKIGPMRKALTPEGIGKDGAAFVAWLDQQKEVDPAKRVGAAGYCMGGPFTFRTAAAAVDRVGAIASFHGARLVTGEPTSPHLLLAKMKAAVLVCIAQNDHERQPDAKATLEKAAQDAQRPAEIEVYPAQHGWCTIDSPVYDEAQAERAWGRMLATFAEHL